MHALHPLYLALRGLTHDMPQQLQEQIDSATQALTGADVDYDGTMAAKMMIARSLFDSEGAALLQVLSCPRLRPSSLQLPLYSQNAVSACRRD